MTDRELRLRVKRQSQMLEGISRFIKGEKYRVSSGIDDSTTYGYGELDEFGFWEFPVPEGLVKLQRENDKLREIIQEYRKSAEETNKGLERLLEIGGK